MLKKAKAKAAAGEAPGLMEVPQSILESSHHIWLAGLGAFARAQQEGTKLFEALVRQGEDLQVRTRRAATQTAAAARGAATAKAKEMQQMAGGTWDKLEQVFEDRVARALSKLGVYTQNDVQRLAARVDELAEAVNRLIETTPGGAAPATKAAKKRAAGKPKPAGARKPAARGKPAARRKSAAGGSGKSPTAPGARLTKPAE